MSAWLFVRTERENSLYQWQLRMGIVANSRAAEVTRWLGKWVATLRMLAQNVSLQLYMTSLVLGAGTEAVEGQYLRKEATAQRDGFAVPVHSPASMSTRRSSAAWGDGHAESRRCLRPGQSRVIRGTARLCRGRCADYKTLPS
ncbi:MAG: metal-dependent phosphohydrolase [Rhodospirillaceae bacterium]|nr:MAG: metal-dependent phosphohydrolase [Rhodospirillaceae bacterium]